MCIYLRYFHVFSERDPWCCFFDVPEPSTFFFLCTVLLMHPCYPDLRGCTVGPPNEMWAQTLPRLVPDKPTLDWILAVHCIIWLKFDMEYQGVTASPVPGEFVSLLSTRAPGFGYPPIVAMVPNSHKSRNLRPLCDSWCGNVKSRSHYVYHDVHSMVEPWCSWCDHVKLRATQRFQWPKVSLQPSKKAVFFVFFPRDWDPLNIHSHTCRRGTNENH